MRLKHRIFFVAVRHAKRLAWRETDNPLLMQGGNLSLTFCEIANAIDSVRTVPTIIFWENVPGVLNTKDNAFGCFLAGLAGEDLPLQPSGKRWTNAGIVLGPKRAVAWRVLDAQYFGLAQRRKRVFVVASARDGFDPAKVLFEFDGLRRDSAPSRNSRETTATNAQSGIGSGSNPDLMATLCATDNDKWGSNQWVNEGKAILNTIPLNTMTILGRPSDDLKPRMGSEIGLETDPSPTITKAHSHAVAYGIPGNWIGRAPENGGNAVEPMRDIAPCQTKTDVHAVYCVHGTQDSCTSETTAFALGRNNGGENVMNQKMAVRRETHGHEPLVIAPTLTASNDPSRSPQSTEVTNQVAAVHAASMVVRRLTPTECERLQGFPDGYTAIPWRKKPAEQCPDGPRYKALGNSWAVPVVKWIGTRIANSYGQ